MKAAVCRGAGRLGVEEIPVPEVGPGELLVRVEVILTQLCRWAGAEVLASDMLPDRLEAELVTHRFPLEEAPGAIALASRPAAGVLKVVVEMGPAPGGAP